MIQTFSVIALVYIFWVLARWGIRKGRRKRLLSKYDDAEIVERILNREIWPGQTVEQLIDSVGPPDRVLAVSSLAPHHIYSFYEIGTDRFRLEIRVINGRVVSCNQHKPLT